MAAGRAESVRLGAIEGVFHSTCRMARDMRSPTLPCGCRIRSPWGGGRDRRTRGGGRPHQLAGGHGIRAFLLPEHPREPCTPPQRRVRHPQKPGSFPSLPEVPAATAPPPAALLWPQPDERGPPCEEGGESKPSAERGWGFEGGPFPGLGGQLGGSASRVGLGVERPGWPCLQPGGGRGEALLHPSPPAVSQDTDLPMGGRTAGPILHTPRPRTKGRACGVGGGLPRG